MRATGDPRPDPTAPTASVNPTNHGAGEMSAGASHGSSPVLIAGAGERLARAVPLVELSYEAAYDAAERGLVDWSLIGAPLAEALEILRGDAS